MAQWAPYCVGSGYSRYPFESQPRDRHNVAGDNVASQQLNSGGLEWFRGKHVKLAHFSSLSAMSYAYLLSDRFVGEPENCTEELFCFEFFKCQIEFPPSFLSLCIICIDISNAYTFSSTKQRQRFRPLSKYPRNTVICSRQHHRTFPYPWVFVSLVSGWLFTVQRGCVPCRPPSFPQWRWVAGSQSLVIQDKLVDSGSFT